MKIMTFRILMAVSAIGLWTKVLAEENREFPRIFLSGPGGGQSPQGQEECIILVVEGPTISYEANPIASTEVVSYVNKLLEVKNASYIGVYPREGTKYGDVVRALEVLRGTKAKSIALSIKELALGRQP